MRLFKFTLIIVFAVALGADAQLVVTPKGPVEFIGLDSWPPLKLLDTLAVLEPGKRIAACAADLRFKLGFPAAAVVGDYEGADLYLIVTVVEPRYASAIKYKASFRDTLPQIDRWSAAFELFDQYPNDFFFAVQFYAARNIDSTFSFVCGFADSVVIRKTWRIIEAYSKPVDEELALRALRTDGNHKNRILAVSVISNFLKADSICCELVDVFRDPDDRVSTAASAVLNRYAKSSPRVVDWRPAARSLRALIDGTNLFAFRPLLEILTETRVSSELAAPLLKGGGTLLLAYLGAHREKERQLVRRFLSQIAGKDYGPDANGWRLWINSL